MRNIIWMIFICLTILYPYKPGQANAEADHPAFIIEVEGDPHEHKEYLTKTYPSIEIVAVYDKLLNGLAFKMDPKEVKRLSGLDFVKEFHLVKNYETPSFQSAIEEIENVILPQEVNNTSFTGRNVKVAVIDTGIDYDHEDLHMNYKGGFDAVDLDDDPMETLDEPVTMHGTHVAGIIAANGKLQGVAPEAEIYAYRALGPGGMGTSIQVIAAMEQALEDGVHIMNLSLGNSVNGPDYPTSVAVERAIDHGVMVVIANGNSGPSHWTVGAPATAERALSVGALHNEEKVPYLYESFQQKKISLQLMQGSLPWSFTRDHIFVDMSNEQEQLTEKIAVIKRGERTFYEKALSAQEKGALALLIANNEAGDLYGNIENESNPLTIPVAAISEEDGKWLFKHLQTDPLYLDTRYERIKRGVSSFSSRGPVTLNWQIKPEVVAPGAHILSTVTGGGYEVLDGTSMAAPHVSGALAVMKEAKPHWDTEQIIGALQTTAKRLYDDRGVPLDPIEQGMGEIQLSQALLTETIIYKPLLSFGMLKGYRSTEEWELTIENTSEQALTYIFHSPNKVKGILWELPLSFTIPPHSKKVVPIGLHVTGPLAREGMEQGWLTLQQDKNEYHLPYLLINQTVDLPSIEGFEIEFVPFSESEANYKLYVTGENIRKISVHLYQPDTFIYDRKLLEITEVQEGLNEGKISKKELGRTGVYQAVFDIELTNGLSQTMEKILFIQ